MTDRKAKILQRLDERLGLPLNQAGWLLGLGRHQTKVAAAEGKIPVNEAGTVPVPWIKRQLQLGDAINLGQPKTK